MPVRRASLIVAAAFALTVHAAGATAQTSGPGGPGGPGGAAQQAPGARRPMGPPGAMNPNMQARMCSLAGIGFGDTRIEQIEQSVKLTEAQRPKFNEFKTALQRADETIKAACPTQLPLTTPGRMGMMEKHMTGMLESIKTLRPALEAFYATLDDEQKARLDASFRPQRPGRPPQRQ